ncbi:MAG: hypothetical protein N2738_04100 [Thermodesulfovibrionales bacterium]|nr:hypothetical protein [Thermodesulfovibrionales bacterium]
MNIDDLNNIGKQLFLSIGNMRLRPFESQDLGKGAAGDKTFPIDKKAEDIVIKCFESMNIPITIISEEIGYVNINGGSSLKVLLDPIDGSKNAITGIPIYCTSIAIIDGNTIGDVFMALVVNLLTGDCFTAQKGKGAYFNGIQIKTQLDDGFYLLTYEAQNPRIDIPKIMNLISVFRRTRCFGSIAIDMAYTAYGAVSIFITPAPSRTFDFAAGWLLIKEAGGVITDLLGNSIEDVKIGIDRSVPIIASGNIPLHEKALKIINNSK